MRHFHTEDGWRQTEPISTRVRATVGTRQTARNAANTSMSTQVEKKKISACLKYVKIQNSSKHYFCSRHYAWCLVCHETGRQPCRPGNRCAPQPVWWRGDGDRWAARVVQGSTHGLNTCFPTLPQHPVNYVTNHASKITKRISLLRQIPADCPVEEEWEGSWS